MICNNNNLTDILRVYEIKDSFWVMRFQSPLVYFSECSHVAYQIKADDAGNNMVGNFLPTDTPLTQGCGQKVILYLFLKVVMLHIKLKAIEHRAP